ncbi:NACHT domain- and WD repeat-containing protein 1 [Bombina bombina]|uniref:NACHT domain- and WD repeat-containing protein 1 n=1 Tax=Bombina bombina TaxID=8345 RepID=UPI00235A4998|nr:NACHT domain- and WD repeat-containing protein 1 [Bombina bombina]
MDQETLQNILRGKETPLPPETSNVVRLFISSTFSDMVAERDAIIELAYPEVQKFCQKNGLEFELVDMRWGVSDYATVDHKTTELCLREIEHCQKTSMGPYFMALVGQRYGFRPIPRVIYEEEFNILYEKVKRDESDAELLRNWYWKDLNSEPPSYIMQPITVHLPYYADPNPAHAELKERDFKEWRQIEKRLAQALRAAAEEAYIEGKITQEQKHKYFKSVTEGEIECGFLTYSSNSDSATIFMREVMDVDLCDNKIFNFFDVKEDGSPDTEAQEYLGNLKSRIIKEHADNVKTHMVEMSKERTKSKYLQDLCDQFIAVVNHQILKSLPKKDEEQAGPESWKTWLVQEITHHIFLSHKKSEVFCGRQELLHNIINHVRNSSTKVHPPLVIYGASGSGKTAIMCKAFEMLRPTSANNVILILRLLGTSPQSSEIHDVLKGLCYQVSLALDLPPPSAHVMNIYNETVRFFHQLLTTVSERRKEMLVIFLDSLDQLSPSEGAHRLHWLPKECPVNVHIIVSTLPQEGGILKTLQETVTDSESFLEVQSLPPEQGSQMVEMLMASAGRRLTPAQVDIVLRSFKLCSQPLLLRLAFDEAKRWASYTPTDQLDIAPSTKAAVHQLYQRLEQLHGKLLVSHSLGYIVASRNGLSEAELKDILSIDNEVLSNIYQYWAPPRDDVIRFPSLPWTFLRVDLEGYLVERQADRSTVLGLYHRQFVEVAQEMYLCDSEKLKIHSILADYFLGTWSLGIKHPIQLPFINKSLNADRKVAPQPLWFSEDMPNLRKMSELPYHLLNAGRIEELKKEVLGSMEWISSKTISCGFQTVLEDFKMSVERIGCPQLRLVHDTLRLFQPTINFIEGRIDPCIIYTEMLARLHFFHQSCPSLIGDICQQCTAWFDQYPNPTLMPTCGFFQPPGGPLLTTVTGFKQGVTYMELSADFNLLVVGSDDGTMIVWNIKDIEVIHTLIGHSAGICCVKVFGQGFRAVSGSLDNTLMLWNLVTGKSWQRIHEDHCSYENAYLHVDEKNYTLYSAAGSQVYVYNIQSGDLILRLSPGVPNFPLQAAVFPPQQLLVTVTEGGTVHIWDVTTGSLQGSRQLPGVDGEGAIPVCNCIIRKHGKMIVGFKNGSLALISTGGGVSTEKMVCALTFVVVADDESLFAAGFGNQVQVFRADSNTFRTFLNSCLEHEDLVESAVISSEKNIIVTGSQDETIRIWSLSQRGVLLDSFYGMGVPVTMLILCDNTLVSASRNAYYLKLWNLEYDKQHKTLPPFQDRSGCIALSDGGKRVYFPKTGDKHKVIVWSSEQGLVSDILESSSEVTCMEIGESKRILLCGLASGTVLAFPLDQRQDVACIPPPDKSTEVVCLSLSKRENHLAVAYHHLIVLYDVSKGDPNPLLDGPIHSIHPGISSAVCRVAILEDWRVLYGMEGGELCHFSCVKDKGRRLESHGSKITCLETSNNEVYALSGCRDSVQRLWNLETGKWEYEMCYKGFFFQGIECACFSQDDKYIYTGSQDRAIKVWDVATGNLLAVQYVYATVTRIVCTQDGFIATTRLGYVIHEQFRCPQTISPQYDPLKNIKATCTVISRKKKKNKDKADEKAGKSRWRCRDQTTKTSQICHIV